MPVNLDVAATPSNFDDAGYLAANPDVAAAVKAGAFTSSRQHFDLHGATEGRRMRITDPAGLAALRREKMTRLSSIIRRDVPCVVRDGKLDFLTDELRKLAGADQTDAVSANGYAPDVIGLIARHKDGLVLDCGAGQRNIYYENVVNLEIADYDSTDVLAIGEELPFTDNSFDAVISVAVLEHVRDPFRCAREIARVLKPGGELYCVVPFLQPLHGYPHHYYNMTHEGLKALFDGLLKITRQDVLVSTGPVFSLTWFLQRWSACLPPAERQTFADLRIGDLLTSPYDLLDKDWVKALPKPAQFELASATALTAVKSAA
jgi:SAM-dependent methyltransferase